MEFAGKLRDDVPAAGRGCTLDRDREGSLDTQSRIVR